MLSLMFEDLHEGQEVRISLNSRKEVITGVLSEITGTYLVVKEERYEGLTQKKYVAGKYIEEIIVFEG